MDIPAANFPDSTPSGKDPLREVAQGLETAFLTEMLRNTELVNAMALPGNAPSPFASLLTQSLAERISSAGGIGLADSLYRQMKGVDG